jgi:hypothetical protein
MAGTNVLPALKNKKHQHARSLFQTTLPPEEHLWRQYVTPTIRIGIRQFLLLSPGYQAVLGSVQRSARRFAVLPSPACALNACARKRRGAQPRAPSLAACWKSQRWMKAARSSPAARKREEGGYLPIRLSRRPPPALAFGRLPACSAGGVARRRRMARNRKGAQSARRIRRHAVETLGGWNARHAIFSH